MTLNELAELIGVTAPQNRETIVRRVSGVKEATDDAIVFAQNSEALREAVASNAGVILAPLDAVSWDERMLRVRDPKYMFAVCARALGQEQQASDDAPETFIHASAVIHASAKIGKRTRVGAAAVIETGVVVGDDCSIASHVTLCRGAQIGDRVVIQPGAVLGSTGFGYVTEATTGKHLLFPQQGRLIVANDVEIGANTTIDRGALGNTRIGQGTKIDNQVHIGHNCIIGKNVLIAAQVGISGSCTVGDGAVLAGQVGLGDHVTIGPGVILGGAAGVFPGKRLSGPGQMFMGVPAEPLKDYLKTVARLRRLK